VAVVALADEVSYLSDIGHHDGQAARHGLRDRDRESFRARREDEHARAGVELLHVGPEAQEVDRVADSQALGEGAQVGFDGTPAYDGGAYPRPDLAQRCDRLHEVVETLARDEL